MDTTFVASGSYYSGSSSSGTITKPTNTSNDDIIFVLITHLSGYTTSTSGWTSLGQNSFGSWNVELLYKIASSEPSSYTFDFSNSAQTGISMCVYRGGFNTSDPIDVNSNTTYQINDTTVRAAGINISKDSSAVIFAGLMANGSTTTFTAPSGFTENFDSGDVSSLVWQTFALGELDSGATGNIDAIASNSNTFKHAFAVALSPLSSGGGAKKQGLNIGLSINL